MAARPQPGRQQPDTRLPGTQRPDAQVLRPERGGLFRRLRALRHTSPGRLQLALAALLTLGLLTGLVGGLTGYSAGSATSDLGNRAQPLLVEAEAIYSGLAEADTTAAQAFLAGGLEPAALTRRYDDALTRATTALASAARRTPEGSPAAASIEVLANGVARYAALVATARAVNRQGLPVGASYLSSASALNRDVLLPQAQALFRGAQDEVAGGYDDATGAGWRLLLTVLVAGLLAALLLTQAHLSLTTKRTFNVPLVGATVLTALLALGSLIVLSNQSTHLNRAGTTGSQPASALAEVRILVLRERGDEALTLAARGGGAAYDKDFEDARASVGTALGNEYLTTKARGAHQTYLETHETVRELDKNGDYDAAVKLAIGDQTTEAFETLTAEIATALEGRKAAFTAEIGTAGRGLGLLTVLVPLLALAVCVLAAAGIRARLEEYR
ncbi:hypothetical protein Ari01nite_47820 [Paractinoplanes rishiriensis]|uniref:Secreted protein n=1 Tax=Paractinoplanes rishiriensis TaxID=1050105 RepID=A0A919K1T6_9ACTN|nr:hypothetical protein Ari01nite_47820 [Actinoplanes rishiriensis]